MTNSPANVLKQVESLPAPRHLFVFPRWADPADFDRLLDEGYLTCRHSQRDKEGRLQVVMNLHLTPKAVTLLHPEPLSWSERALKASAAGVTMIGICFLVRYLG